MSQRSPEFWPFDGPTTDLHMDLHQPITDFFEAAYRSGFCPRKFTRPIDGEYLAEAQSGRWAELIYRGRADRATKRWEVALGEPQTREQAFWTDFPHAADAVLVWLRGGSAADVLAAVEGHVIRGAVIVEPVAVGPASS